MKIIYIHHAERDRYNGNVPRQEQDITEDGIMEAKILAKKMEYLNPVAIYSSPYKRCIHTAEILRGDLNIPIIEDGRFNEYEVSETSTEFLNRNMKAIDDIVNKYDEDDVVLCITSGVNLSAFVCYFNGEKANEDSIMCQALSISPVLFTTDGKVL